MKALSTGERPAWACWERRAAANASAADLPVVRGGRLLPGVNFAGNAALQRVLDDGLPPQKLR